MRIALACPYAWDDPGGVQVHVRELAERLLARGHAVVVLAPVRGQAPEPWVIPIGRPVDIRYNRSNAPIDPRPWSRGPVRGALAAFQPDIVHAHQPTAPSTGMWATLDARVPVVGSFHSGATRSRLYDVAAPLLRRVARRLSARIAVSERAAEFERARIGGVFSVIPNGVEAARFADAEPRQDLPAGRRLLFVGRLDERKGFAVAVEAFAIVAEQHPGTVLVVVGDGPARGAVDRLAPEVSERVFMLGALPNVDLPPIHAACDLYLGPVTGGESFGIVLVEAMAAGLPVVASDTPGYDEVVRDGVDGLLVPPRDAAALAGAAARILDDEVFAARLAGAGRERAAMFDWGVVVPRIEAVYDEALEAGPSVR
ncbi:MAG: glycosyltransferase family 4 protein [Actinomycetota bacterium]